MFYQPSTVQEALEIKAEYGTEARFLAGGTDLVVMMKKGRWQPQRIIDLSRLDDLCYVSESPESMTIGASCTHSLLEDSDVAVLAAAARQVGGPQIRNRGTVAGNLATASPAGDVSVALLALDAELEIISLRGIRRLSLSDFFLAPGKTALNPDEMILSINFRKPDRSRFYKVGKRNSVAISVVCVGVSLWGDGTPAIALGSVAPRPLRIRRAEEHLITRGLSPEAIAEAGRITNEDVSPITDHRAGADYRRDISGTLVARLLTDLTRGGR